MKPLSANIIDGWIRSAQGNDPNLWWTLQKPWTVPGTPIALYPNVDLRISNSPFSSRYISLNEATGAFSR